MMSSLPYEASKNFSKKLLPHHHSLIDNHTEEGVEGNEYMRSLNGATANKGVLSEREKRLQPSVDKFYQRLGQAGETASAESTRPPTSPSRSKRILMLGSGMVAKPAVDMIAAHPGTDLIIASNSLPELQSLVQSYTNVKYRVADASDPANYTHLIEELDVVISLLPVSFHPKVAKLCIEHKKHLVTASYISPEMASLDESAKNAEVLLLNEICLDPGIDHCSAIDLLSRIRAQGQEVVSFTSFCGGGDEGVDEEGDCGYGDASDPIVEQALVMSGPSGDGSWRG